MPYCIEYIPVTKKKYTPDNHPLRLPALILTVFMGFCAAVYILWPQGKEVLRELLIPGDPDTTIAALEAFAQQLRGGESIMGAVECFCREILTDANLP